MQKLKLRQTQSEAIVWLLIVAQYIDSHISLAEGEIFNRQLAKLPWSSPIPIYKFADRLTANARFSIGNSALMDHQLEQCLNVFNTIEHQEFALREVTSILEADGLTDTEEHFIQRIRITFGMEETVILTA